MHLKPAVIPGPFQQRVSAIGPGLLARFVLASVPALLLGLWAVGLRSAAELPSSWIDALATGAALWLPRVLLALFVSVAWAVVFSRVRNRQLDTGWLYLAWMFVLLLPAATPLPLVVIGLSFGLLFGCHAFGGTGRYIVNPALLGLVFLEMAYPAAMDHYGVAGASATSTWSLLAGGGPEALFAAGITWRDVVLGLEVAVLGAPSAVLCLAGLGYLVARRLAPWRLPVGALAGLLAMAWLFGGQAWYWFPALGSFTLALAFIACDPTTVPESRAGQWSMGLLFGALTAILRTLNPDHPEGSLQALLLASLAAPVIDHWAALRRRDDQDD
ncbi:MAG: hypothetical protein HKN58_03590 [Xanthomonadales bacterium]|nr:hypothetical protein [Xanthomonadales bacterium]